MNNVKEVEAGLEKKAAIDKEAVDKVAAFALGVEDFCKEAELTAQETEDFTKEVFNSIGLTKEAGFDEWLEDAINKPADK